MTVKVRKFWPTREGPHCHDPVKSVEVVFPDMSHLDVEDLPATGRVVVEMQGGLLTRVTLFDEGPSRRDVKNSRWRK